MFIYCTHGLCITSAVEADQQLVGRVVLLARSPAPTLFTVQASVHAKLHAK